MRTEIKRKKWMKAAGAVLLAGAVLAPLLAFAGDGAVRGVRYDVSYLWTRSKDGVFRYRDQVAKTLGPEVAKHLLVVKQRRYYGLIYDRDGAGSDAYRIARNHTQVLRENGLEGAAPTRSVRWAVVEGEARVSEVELTDLGATAEMEEEIEEYVKSLRRRGKLRSDETTAWSVYDFASGQRLVTINVDKPLQAASMVKPFFALAYMHEVRAKRKVYTPTAKTMMRRMIQHSNNAAANWVLRELGGPAKVQSILRANYPEMFAHTRVVEYIPPGGRTYRNKAAVRDYNRFLISLWHNELPGSWEIKRLMKLPSGNRIYDGAAKVPVGTIVYSKTGSTKHLCGDMGILVARGKDGERYPYVIVGVIEKQAAHPNYTAWIRSRGDVIRDVSSLIYERLARRHNLLTTTQTASSR
ncbi:MAG: serine hydrolase [Elusimicrobia bacterium CG_4_9_14_3_um_filter_62_55]|nr:MAG: serine hydrolase [Elusimicrobia bacterium CG_4_10_14_0_2_um_filter_63_34]PJB23857.1 MAG: serine hydrolase [Elusimicrobia bacterium CG_4_9_14_3_um_filter_62_55]